MRKLPRIMFIFNYQHEKASRREKLLKIEDVVSP